MVELDLVGKVVLIGQAYFERYAGSEIVTLEIAEHFAARGAKVLIATRTHGEPIVNEIGDQESIQIHDWASASLDESLRTSDVHLSWIQHHVLPPALLDGGVKAPIVFAHLSAIHPVEFPLLDSVEESLASAVVFTTQRARTNMQASGALTQITDDLVEIFANPAPLRFHEPACPIAPGPPWKVCVVSNHPPQELSAALELLGDEFEIVRVGRQHSPSSTIKRVDPELIDSVHAVVSIGKTVQYALVRGRAVYCYDHFGGPGWLNAENIVAAGERNYSGRGFSRAEAPEIADSIREGIGQALVFAEERKELSRDQYHLGSTLDVIEKLAARHFTAATQLDSTLAAQHVRLQQLVTRLSQDWSGAARAASEDAARRRRAESKARQLQEKQDRLDRELGEVNAALSESLLELDAANSAAASLKSGMSAQIRNLEYELENSTRREGDALAAQSAMANSISWRVTRPLRAVRRAFTR